MTEYTVAVVGATGVVGEQMRKILAERDFPVKKLKLLASALSAGKTLSWKGEETTVEELTPLSFHDIDIALFSAGARISREYAPIAAESGTAVIDNSSAWRMDDDVPLVVPEVNRQALAGHKKIIANPNCSTIQMVTALKPLHDRWTMKRVVVSTYQAVSGAGLKAIQELLEQTRAHLDGRPVESKVMPHRIALNLLPQIDVFVEGGYTKEEIKMINETRKIMALPNLRITATAVRVPVVTGHSESVNVEFVERPDPEEARKILSAFPGVEVIDDPDQGLYPMPFFAAGADACFIGRLRMDHSVDCGLNFWVVSDNLRKGAALNAVQIAECLIEDQLL